MNTPAPARPRTVLVRGLAPCFALMMCDPRVSCALRMACVNDAIEVHYPESHISCRLRRLSPTGPLLCAFSATHFALDGSVEGRHRVDLVLDGIPGSAVQREALLRHFRAFQSAATASRVRTASRVPRAARSMRRPLRAVESARQAGQADASIADR